MSTKDVIIKISEQGAEEAAGGLGKVDNQLANLVKGVGAAYLSIEGLKRAFNFTVVAAAQDEMAFRKLQTAVNLTGTSYQTVEKDIKTLTAGMQKMTQYGDEEVAGVLANMITLTGSYERSVAQLPLVLNMASTGLFDLDSAARYVAMALEGNVTMLGRYIPQLKNLDDILGANATNAQRAEYAMKLLNEKFNDTARENVKSAIGQYQQLKNELGEIGETIGGVVLPPLTAVASGLNEFLRSLPQISKALVLSAKEGIAYEVALERVKKATKDVAEESKNIVKNAREKEKVQKKSIELLAEEAQQLKTVLGFNEKMEEMAAISLPVSEMSFDTKDIEKWRLATQYADMFGENIANALVYGRALGPAVVASLEAIAAELIAKAAVFALLQVITGGSASTISGLMSGGTATSFLGTIFGGAFANGGDFIAQRPQLILVGERQPERVTVSPLTPGNNPKYANTYQINIYGDGWTEETIAEKLLPAMNRIIAHA